jgi:hypothetical protein
MNTTIDRLRELAQEVRAYQLTQKWADAALVREISHVGSSKTYKRILDPHDDLDQLNLENQLRNFEAAIETIKIRRLKDKGPQDEYEDFDNIDSGLEAVSRAAEEDTIARFVVIEGETGTGKDAVKNAILRARPKTTIVVEASENWKESATTPLGSIIKAMDIRRRRDEVGDKFTIPNLPQARLDLIIEELGSRRMILVINEAHHMGPRAINLIKTIINSTKTAVVFLCVPALLHRLLKNSHEECIQLFGNRLCKRVRLKNPPPNEILQLLERRGIRYDDAQTANLAAMRLSAEIQVADELQKRGKGKLQNEAAFSEAFTQIESDRVPSRYIKA